MDIKKILETKTELKVAENRFIKPPSLPYIIFIEEKDIRGISANNLIVKTDVSIELYTTSIDKKLENEIRNVIISDILFHSQNDESIEISQDRVYIESEQMYMTTYDFILIEKGGN